MSAAPSFSSSTITPGRARDPLVVGGGSRAAEQHQAQAQGHVKISRQGCVHDQGSNAINSSDSEDHLNRYLIFEATICRR